MSLSIGQRRRAQLQATKAKQQSTCPNLEVLGLKAQPGTLEVGCSYLLTQPGMTPVSLVQTNNATNFNTAVTGPRILGATTISSISPSSTPVGSGTTLLTVFGSNFTQVSTVMFDGFPLSTAYESTNELTSTVPEELLTASGTASISVIDGGILSNSVSFSIGGSSSNPMISSISPSSVSAGFGPFTLTVNGSGFNLGSSVRLSGSPVSTNFVSSTQLTATIPSLGTGSYPISVVNGVNVSNTVFLNVGSTPPGPILSSLSPSSAAQGSGTFTMGVSGSGFVPGAIVNLNANALVTSYISSLVLTATVPSSSLIFSGTFPVSVTQGSNTSNTLFFTVGGVSPGNPSISFLFPSSAPAGSDDIIITLSGTNFNTSSVVYWNGIALETTYNSGANQLTADVPSNLLQFATTANITVQNEGVGSNSVPFTVTGSSSPPTLSSVTPNSIATGSPTTTITLTGTGFTASSVVLWNGTPLSTFFNPSFPNQLVAQVPAAFLSSPTTASVEVLQGSLTSNSMSVSVGSSALPILSLLAPAFANTGSGPLSLTVLGSGFTPDATIYFNGMSLNTTTFTNSGQLTATIPASSLANSGTVNVQVIEKLGASNTLPFTISPGTTPTLFSVSPSTIPAGSGQTSIVITGATFTNGMVVLWNGTALTTTFNSSGQLTAQVPAIFLTAPTTANIRVGGSNTLQLTVGNSGGSAVIISWGPKSIQSGSPNPQISFNGVGFTGNMQVYWTPQGSSTPTVLIPSSQTVNNVIIIVPGNLITEVQAGTMASIYLKDPFSLIQSQTVPLSIT